MSRREAFIRYFQRNQKWFKASDEVLKAMFAARGGGKIAWALAAFSSFGTAMEMLYPASNGWPLLRELGLQDANLTIGGFVCEILLRRMPCQVVAVSQWGTSTHLWSKEDGTPLAGAVFQGPKFSDGPFIFPGTQEEVFAAVRDVVWAEASELQLDVIKSGDSAWRAAGRFHLEPMLPLGPFIGKRRPEWFAERLRRYPEGRPLTVRFRGPTGAGKTVLARHLSRLLRPGSSRTLKISSEVLRKCRADEVRGLVEWLQPTVLILDDLELRENNEFFLGLLESLRHPSTLTVITEMTKFADKEEPKPGVWHVPGGRPGRIDETFYFGPPDKTERGWILDHYAGREGIDLSKRLRKKLVKASDGLTGAYIGRIVLRLATHGTKDWQHEVDQVLYVAPFRAKEKGPEEGESKGETPPVATVGKAS